MDVCVLVRRAPYGTVYGSEALRVAGGLAASGLKVVLAAADDGVYLLRRGQDPRALAMANLEQAARQLSDYGVAQVLADSESLAERGLALADLIEGVELIDSVALGRLLAQIGKVLVY